MRVMILKRRGCQRSFLSTGSKSLPGVFASSEACDAPVPTERTSLTFEILTLIENMSVSLDRNNSETDSEV